MICADVNYDLFVSVLYYQTLKLGLFVLLKIKMKGTDDNKLDKHKVALEQHNQY